MIYNHFPFPYKTKPAGQVKNHTNSSNKWMNYYSLDTFYLKKDDTCDFPTIILYDVED